MNFYDQNNKYDISKFEKLKKKIQDYISDEYIITTVYGEDCKIEIVSKYQPRNTRGRKLVIRTNLCQKGEILEAEKKEEARRIVG